MPHDRKPEDDPDAPRLDAESPTLTEGPEAATEGFGAGEERLLVGQNLGGRYQVVGRLGAGGMGAVFSAHDEVGDDLRRRWDDPDLTLVDGDHPVVFAGIGSLSTTPVAAVLPVAVEGEDLPSLAPMLERVNQ